MSSMLEQAIVDASALREAAIQSAEQAVINQYSGQIKEVVESLLQEDSAASTSFGADAPKDKDTEYEKSRGGIEQQVPDAFGPEVDDNMVLEIDLANLDLGGIEYGVGRDKITPVHRDKVPDLNEEEVDLDQEDLEELAESLTMDWKKVPDGGFANGQMRPAVDYEDENDLTSAIAAAIKEYSEEAASATEEKDKESTALKKENKKLKLRINKLLENRQSIVATVKQVEQKFNAVQLSNAKLFYTNKTLMDNSLNERQKNKIVESISDVSSIEQAKIVYETLQSTVGTLSDRKRPESLSEVVSKRNSSSILLHSRKPRDEKKKDKNDFAERMKRLAGIN